MARTRAERRFVDLLKARRKQKLCTELYYDHEWYNNLHQYSKNKIHCSCPMCSGTSKTNRKKVHGGGARCKSAMLWGTTDQRNGKNWSIRDLKRIEEMKYEVEELAETGSF